MVCWFVLAIVWYCMTTDVCILSARGPLPLLIYSRGVGLQGKCPIWYYTMSCGARWATPCMPWSCGLDHLWWCGPCLVLWIPRIISPKDILPATLNASNKSLYWFVAFCLFWCADVHDMEGKGGWASDCLTWWTLLDSTFLWCLPFIWSPC